MALLAIAFAFQLLVAAGERFGDLRAPAAASFSWWQTIPFGRWQERRDAVASQAKVCSAAVRWAAAIWAEDSPAAGAAVPSSRGNVVALAVGLSVVIATRTP